MSSSLQALALVAAFGSSLSFSTASVVFARFSREISSPWMNTMKASVAAVAFAIVLLLSGTWVPLDQRSGLALLTSGAIGLGIGDLFLLSAYARIGVSRTLMVFSFQPLLIGFASALIFGQDVGTARAIAILFFIACLFLLSFERYRSEGHWEIRGLVFALIGVGLDNSGVILSRWAFDQSQVLEPQQANLVRIAGALAVFAVFSLVKPIGLVKHFIALKPRDRALALGAPLVGTFLSLSLYLFAVKNGHLATVSAIVLSGPVLAALIESIVQKKPPSRYLIGGLLCLFLGMGLVFSS